MRIGDLIKFTGSWGMSITPGERRTGVVMEVWTNGRTGRIAGLDVLWDNGDYSHIGSHAAEVINENR